MTMTTLIAQCKWETLRQIRNRRFFFFTILLPIGFYFLFTHVFGNQSRVGGESWGAYYLISMATFGVVGGAINGLSSRIAFDRTQGWQRLQQTTPLPTWMYLAGKIVSQLLTAVVSIILLFVVGSLGNGVHLSATVWLAGGLWLVIGSLPFIALGILIGLVAGTEGAQIVASGVYFLLSIAGGLWMPVQVMPKVMQDIAHWMPTYRLADATWRLAAGHSPQLADVTTLGGYLAVLLVLTMWFLRRVEARTA